VKDEITVRPTVSRADQQRFQRLPWSIYAGDPNWVPPLIAQERALLGWKDWAGKRHAFYAHAEAITFIAERGGIVVGRIAALVNHVHNEKYRARLALCVLLVHSRGGARARAL